jgi:hypothetical protein
MVQVSTRRVFKHEDRGWEHYVEWIGRPDLREVRTIDVSLNEYVDRCGDYHCELGDVDRAIRGLPVPRSGFEYYLLAARCHESPTFLGVTAFNLLGYDLCDETMTSSLLNCGPWDGRLKSIAIRMNRYGLLRWEDAQLAKDMLPQEWGEEEPHAWVDVWALYGRDS